MDEYIGTIKLWAGTFEPKGFMICDGRKVAIRDNQALFSILGTTYGGDGQTYFNIPDLRGNVPVGANNQIPAGQKLGSQTIQLTPEQLPAHTHDLGRPNFKMRLALNARGYTNEGTNAYLGSGGSVANIFSQGMGPSESQMANDAAYIDGTTNATGNGAAISVMQPSLGIYYIICVEGIYPQRN